MKKTLFLVGALLLSQGLFAQDLKQGNLTNVKKLTSGTEKYENPRWSPDGQMIAYTNFGYDGLYVMNSDGSAKSKISERIGIGYMYQWSGDSEQILVRDTRWDGGSAGAGDRHHAIFAIDLNANEVRMTEDASYMQPASWRYSVTGEKTIAAPDAKVIVKRGALKPVASKKLKAVLAQPTSKVSFIANGEQLYVVDAEGNKKMISDKVGFCPALSPDGKKVAYNEVDDVVVMNIDGTGKKVIGVGFNPSWVNNSQIVFEKTTDDGHTYLSGELYLANIATGAIKQLTSTSNMIEMNPCVSPDGSKVVFQSFTDGQIYVADLK
ncbi:MAG: hypothetical protein ACI30S_01705 [Muribaculaceae bacterium]